MSGGWFKKAMRYITEPPLDPPEDQAVADDADNEVERYFLDREDDEMDPNDPEVDWEVPF
jgi:hypothetical protein